MNWKFWQRRPAEDEPDSEVEIEFEPDEPDVADTWVADGEVVLHAKPFEIEGQAVFATAMVAGDVYLGLTSDMKMHKLEIVKGFPAKPRSQVSAIK